MVFESNLSIIKDVERCYLSFLKQFNSMYSKFNFLDMNILSFLFNSYCTSFYGSETWYNFISKSRTFNKIKICYHKALKKIAGMTPWHSSHEACFLVGVYTFDHFLSIRILSLLFRIINSESNCLANLKYYFKLNSFLHRNVKEHFLMTYGVENVIDNDFEAIKARVGFVYAREKWSEYVPFT